MKKQTPFPSVQGRRWYMMSSWAGSRKSAHIHLVPPHTERPEPTRAFAMDCVSGRPGRLAQDAEESNQSSPGQPEVRGRPRRHVGTPAGLSRSSPKDGRHCGGGVGASGTSVRSSGARDRRKPTRPGAGKRQLSADAIMNPDHEVWFPRPWK